MLPTSMASPLSSNPAMGGNLSEEAHMTDEFKQYKEKRPWPVQRRKLQVFSEDPTLSKLENFLANVINIGKYPSMMLIQQRTGNNVVYSQRGILIPSDKFYVQYM